MIDKKLNLLGLAQAASSLVSGEERVIQAIQQGEAKLVVVANDASPSTQEKINNKCSYYQVPINLDYKMVDISQALGKKRSICAFTNKGFAASFQK